MSDSSKKQDSPFWIKSAKNPNPTRKFRPIQAKELYSPLEKIGY